MSNQPVTGIQSVRSALRVVEEMVSLAEPIGVTALAERVEMTKVRVFRYLRTLQQLGYVEQDPRTERYFLTLKLWELGEAVAVARRPRRACVTACGA